MPGTFKFSPISFSWVAIHPQPKGVIQFIGGAFFGTFPTVFYRYFLQTLFEEGYTIIALPFRFSFRHWAIAIDLLKEQEILRHELTEIANKLGYQNEIYQDKANYFWLGHSLGCKYIALLEFLSGQQWKQITESSLGQAAYQQIEALIVSAGLENASILDQPSLLIAPDISDTESAIPVRPIAHFLDRIGLGAKPTRDQTQRFVERSLLFNLTALISFDSDTLAGSETDECRSEDVRSNSDVLWLFGELKKRKFPILHKELEGKHLEPLGVKIGEFIVDLNPFDIFIKPLQRRQLEQFAILFLDELKQRQSQLSVDLESLEDDILNSKKSSNSTRPISLEAKN
ncbi:MAG: DUF1350 family protein [Drouetiella hepatica Uher 2000/2452]|jgi:hypothetical protein|uniref:DUF1350 family protein n=1 Tax=Drouetiella hepatica Uher 2000/2452 TaxID=904376 RepID=A0A951UMM0_9CYAN|nr:DUF1350 family protein [Drouetiella hepatica Uher 2000/2452]